MDVLTNKRLREYESLSRYQEIPIYFHLVDNKYTTGISKWLYQNTNYTTHKIKSGDTLDSLALRYYGDPTYYWVLADFNRLNDPFVDLIPGYLIKIPTLTSIEFGD